MSTRRIAPALPDAQLSGRSHRTQLIPSDDAAARSLVAVIAILTFLAALAAAGANVVARSSAGWIGAISQEATVQVRLRSGRDIEADLARATVIARETPGIITAEPLSKSAAEEMLEPWLGRGLDLGSLPVPRLVALKLAAGRPDLGTLARRLAAEIPTATLDDHRQWSARLSAFSGTVAAVASVLVAIVLAASGLAVAFATRGAMTGSREVVDVLRLVGAEARFIAGAYAASFVRVGLKGSALGALAALAVLAAGALWVSGPGDDRSGSQLEGLLGSFAVDWTAVVLLALVALSVTAVVGAVSVATVRRILKEEQHR